MLRTGKVGVVGSGYVGSTAAYAMVLRNVGREIILVDVNRERAQAEADDIRHAVPFAHPINIHVGDYPELAGCRVVVLTAGVNQQPGESRLLLLERNAAIFGEIVPKVLEYAPDAVLVVATNPVDIMTHVAAHLAHDAVGLPYTRVLGSGTTLDTARFRTLLGLHFGVDAQHVHAYVLGEHGDSEVLAWSLVTIGGLALEEYADHIGISLDAAARRDIDARVRRAAYTIIQGKGATYYGIGAAIARIVDAIVGNQRSILTVCSRHVRVGTVDDVTISQPSLVGGDGILATLPQPLIEAEAQALDESALVVKNAITPLGI